MPESTQSDPPSPTADRKCPAARRTRDESLNVLQAGRRCLRQLLAQQLRWRQYVWTSDADKRVLCDPEVRKNIEILAARLSDAIDLNRRQPLSSKVMGRLSELFRELLCEQRKALCLETLLDTRRSMELLLLERPDLQLLRQRTAEEYAGEESTLLTWRQLYGAELPKLLNDSQEPSPEQVQATKESLRRLVAERFELYRPLRARRRLRIIYLCYIAPVLLLAGLLFGLAIGMGAPVVLLAAAAGVTGAALSGLLKFRDEVKLGAQVREFPLFYLVQVGVGAVFGLFVDLFFATGWLTFTPNSAGIGVVAFAAGFSEPFALGIVAKIIKITERASI